MKRRFAAALVSILTGLLLGAHAYTESTGGGAIAEATVAFDSRRSTISVSAVDIHDLIGPNITAYGELKVWFGQVGHVDVGYSSNDPAKVEAQVDEMQRRGLQGAVVDWGGPAAISEEDAVRVLIRDLEKRGHFAFAIKEDLSRRCCLGEPRRLAKTVAEDLTHASEYFYGSSAYLRIRDHPVVFVSGEGAAEIDWQRISESSPEAPMFVFDASSTQPEYSNYTELRWDPNRNCGSDWINALAMIRKYGLGAPTTTIFLLPWNNYDAHAAIEPGIDGCFRISASIIGNEITWRLTGEVSNVDHYVMLRPEGQKLVTLAKLPAAQTSFALDDSQLGAGNSILYVMAVAKPSIRNQISSAILYRATELGSTVTSLESSPSTSPSSTATTNGPTHVIGNGDISPVNALQIQGHGIARTTTQNGPGVNVLAHRAKCDGTTDDTAAFHHAFAAAGKACVLVPVGSCRVNLVFGGGTDSVCLQGQPGRASVLQPYADAPVITLDSTSGGVQRVTLRDLFLDNSKTHFSNDGIRLRGRHENDFHKFSNLEISGFARGLNITGRAIWNDFDNLHIHNSTAEGVRIDVSGAVVNHLSFRNLRSSMNANEGVYLRRTDETLHTIRFDHLNSEKNGKCGLYAQNVAEFDVSNAYIESNGQRASDANNCGIHLGGRWANSFRISNTLAWSSKFPVVVDATQAIGTISGSFTPDTGGNRIKVATADSASNIVIGPVGGSGTDSVGAHASYLGGAVTLTGMSASGKALCQKSDMTIGYCSTAVAADGSCTCN